MNVHHKALVKWASLLLCILTLTLFLVACGYGGDTNTAAAPTPAPTPTPTPPPPPPSYKGDGYTLNYPQGWTYNTQGTATTFTSNTDPTLSYTVDVLAANSGTTPQTYLSKLTSSYQNWKPDTTVAPTTTVGGQPWQQGGGTGDYNGQHYKGVALATQYPATTGKIYVIFLKAKADSYDQVYTNWYKPVLDSYKFTY